MKEEEGETGFQNGKLQHRTGTFILSVFLFLFSVSEGDHSFIFICSADVLFSVPITHPPFYALVRLFLQLPLSLSFFFNSGVDVNPVVLSGLPMAPYNSHLYFTPQEHFSPLVP